MIISYMSVFYDLTEAIKMSPHNIDFTIVLLTFFRNLLAAVLIDIDKLLVKLVENY